MRFRLIGRSRRAVATCAIGLAVAAPASIVAQANRADGNAARLSQVRAWVAAAREHEPGALDDPARSINAWPERDLQTAVADVRAVVRLLAEAKRASERAGGIAGVSFLGRYFTAAEVQDLLGLADDQTRRWDANDLLKRGALLHADIAMLAPPDDTRAAGRPSSPDDVVYLYSDGRPLGIEFAGVHWRVGRALVGDVRPDPAGDAMVRLWYQAMGSHLQSHHEFAHAAPLLAEGRRLFPRDGRILLYVGCIHESYAASRVQAWVGSAQSGSYAPDVRSRRTELQQAEALFREAVKADPSLYEARLRLGRVLALLGRPDEALPHLRQARADASDEVMRYYADLFSGEAEGAAGDREASRAAYQRAAALFPGAQSARLALSHLARQDGDRAGALGAVQQVLAIPGDSARRDDPWWTYHEAHVPDASALLDELRDPFLGGGQR